MASFEDIFLLIRSRYESFTRAEKQVADFILQDPAPVLYMSITDLADACHVGETSVFRFCRDLNVKGYQAFKILLARSINENGLDRPREGGITEKDGALEIMDKLVSIYADVLSEAKLRNSPDAIYQTVDWMVQAKRIHFFGAGSSFIVALEAYSRFLRVESKVAMAVDIHMQTMAASLMEPEDVAIIISYTGSTRDMVEIAKLLRQRRVKIVCITHFEKSPLSATSDLALLCGSKEGPLQSGGIAARISQLYLIDVLYHEYVQRNCDKAKQNSQFTADSVSFKLY